MQNKVKKVMHEYKEGELHSGSKSGPVVKNRKQAIAIGLSEAGRAVGKAAAKAGASDALKKAIKKASA